MNDRECTMLVRRRACSVIDECDEYMEHLPCEHCGMWSAHLERHHRQFRSRGGLWVPSNIVLLCRSCHDLTTHEKLAGTGLNVSATEVPAEVSVVVWYCRQRVFLGDDGAWSPAA